MLDDLDLHMKRFIQRTDQICLDDPQAASIRRTLLELERKGHATGWDGPNSMPRIFQLDAHPAKPEVEQAWCDTYTEQLHMLCDTVFDGNVGRSLGELARMWEMIADFFRNGKTPDSMSGDIIQAFGETIGALDLPPDRDLLGNRCGKRGYRLHGLGMRSEAWGAAAPRQELAKLAASGISEYTGRQEIRMVWYAARDGSMWCVMRARGEMPWSALMPPSMNLGFGGEIVHALSRFVNALASSAVPIAPKVPNSATVHDNRYGGDDRR